MEKKRKKFKLLNPEQWGLNPEKTYIICETERGFSLRIGYDMWIGLPKKHVLNNPGIFKPLYGSNKSKSASRSAGRFHRK